MVQKLILILLATSMLACQQPKAQPKEFTQEQLQEDLNQLFYALKTYHPGLYWYQDSEAFAQQIAKAEASIKNGQDFAEFYKTVNLLTSSIGCGHTRPRMPANRSRQLIDSVLILPLQVFVHGGKVFTTKEIADIPLGSQIVSVDKYKIADIIKQLRAVVPSDGHNTTGKDNFIAQRFGLMLALYLDIQGSQTKTTASVGYIVPDTKSVKKMEINFQPFSNNQQANQGPLMNFMDADMPDTKILRIRTFSSGTLNRNGFNYYDFLKNAFTQLKEEHTKNFIIDVRGNGGGDDHYGATLVSYIANQSFKYFDRIEVTEAYDGYGKIEEEEGRRLMRSHQDLALQQPKKNRFRGKVFILADGGSFSTTADFVSIAKNIKAATIIGIETGGGACGNTSGRSESLKLANTGISLRIQTWGYFSAINKNLICGSGVLPDYEVVDFPFTVEDEMLEQVSALLKGG